MSGVIEPPAFARQRDAMSDDSLKRAAPDNGAGTGAAAEAGGSAADKRARTAITFPDGDFSKWVYDAASGWTSSPDRVWLYHSTNYVFFHR